MGPIVCDGSDLCGEIASDPVDSEFRSVYGRTIRPRVVARRQHVVALVDLAPLLVGHLLIAPTHHYLSFAEAPRAVRADALQLLNELRDALSRLGDIQVVEHGAASVGDRVQPCITHAHWHVLPGAPDVATLFREEGLIASRIASLLELSPAITESAPYFVVSRATDDVTIFVKPPPTPPQLLRKALGQIMGLPEGQYDWCVHQDRRLFMATLKLFDA